MGSAKDAEDRTGLCRTCPLLPRRTTLSSGGVLLQAELLLPRTARWRSAHCHESPTALGANRPSACARGGGSATIGGRLARGTRCTPNCACSAGRRKICRAKWERGGERRWYCWKLNPLRSVAREAIGSLAAPEEGRDARPDHAVPALAAAFDAAGAATRSVRQRRFHPMESCSPQTMVHWRKAKTRPERLSWACLRGFGQKAAASRARAAACGTVMPGPSGSACR